MHQRRVRPQKTVMRTQRERGGYGVRHAEGYIPCLATISVGQDRKYTIEGSSATDKDYPMKNKNTLINVHRFSWREWREWIEISVTIVCVVCGLGKQWCIFVTWSCLILTSSAMFLISLNSVPALIILSEQTTRRPYMTPKQPQMSKPSGTQTVLLRHNKH